MVDKDYYKRYYQENRDILLERVKKWQKDNKASLRAYRRNYTRNYRLKKRENHLRKMFEILECGICGFNFIPALVVHHKNMRPGDNSKENLQLLCANCHRIEHSLNPSLVDGIRRKQKETVSNKRLIRQMTKREVGDRHR